MNPTTVAAARRAVYLLCDVSVAAAVGVADTVAKVAGAVLQNVMPEADEPPGEPDPQPQAQVFPGGAGVSPEVARLLAAAGVVLPAPAPMPQPPQPPAGADADRAWVLTLGRELTGGELAKINGRDYEIAQKPLHVLEDGCGHQEPQNVVHLHLRDVVTREDHVVSLAAGTPLLAVPRIPDDAAGFDGPDAGVAS